MRKTTRSISRTLSNYHRLIAEGRCSQCWKRLEEGAKRRRCQACRVAAQAKYRAKRNSLIATQGDFKMKTCSTCGGKGHNARTCQL